MPAIPDEFPVDPNGWRVCVRGTGDEPQGFTSARDIGKAVVELLAWVGEWVGFDLFNLFHFYRCLDFLSDKDDNTSRLASSRRNELVANISITRTNASVPRSRLRMLQGIGLHSTKRSR